MKTKIVILDAYCVNTGDLSWDKLSSLGEVTIYDRTDEKDVISRISDANVILTNKVRITSSIIDSSPKLKYIGVLATGYDVIDIKAAHSRGIIVTNIPSYSTSSVVQMTFAHILNIVNRVAHYAEENRNGKWSECEDFSYRDTQLNVLVGKTIGIVGLGNIGLRVARMACCFGMDVFALTSKNSSSLPEGIKKTTLDGLLGVSDILSLHCPLTDSTRELINKESIAKMKPGAILINTGRGPLVNEYDVAEALKSGYLGAYGADVMSEEPPSRDNPLFSAPNAFITPHIAWASFEARKRLIEIATSNVKAFIEGKPVNIVNSKC